MNAHQRRKWRRARERNRVFYRDVVVPLLDDLVQQRKIQDGWQFVPVGINDGPTRNRPYPSTPREATWPPPAGIVIVDDPVQSAQPSEAERKATREWWERGLQARPDVARELDRDLLIYGNAYAVGDPAEPGTIERVDPATVQHGPKIS